MVGALPDALPHGSSWTDPDGGMFVWARVAGRPGLDTAPLLPRALEHDVAFVPGAPFFPADPQPATLRLSFTTYGPEAIAEGTRRLARVFRG